MRCSRCGNDNPGPNRFCGMCGASLLAPPPAPAQAQPVSVSTSAGAAPEVAPTRTEPRTEPAKTPRIERPANDRPSISGPSFLGLNDPSPSHSAPRRARLSIDPHSTPGSNLEYLLSDEEQPRHWGPGKILLLLIALALAVGFGYLRFKANGFAWLNPPAKKPDATVAQNPPSDSSQPSAPSGITPESQPAPAAPSSIQPAPESAANTNQPAGAPPVSSVPNASTPSSATETPKTSDAAPSGNPENAPTADKPTTSAEPPTGARPAKKAAALKPTPKPPVAKPSPASKPVTVADPVTEAQKYLYGKGVPQDCEHGIRLLKPAANESNTKAMVEMGALYSAGLCAPHDLPTAYRWFALALRKDPENSAVQADLSKLWGEMTPPERQLAIKLSQ